MVRFVLVYFFIWFSASLAYSQEFRIGPAAAGHFYTTHMAEPEDADVFDTRFKIGYSGGAALSIPFKGGFGIQTEAYFTRQGRKTFDNETLFTNTSTYDFVEMPILLRRTFEFYWLEGIPTTWYFNFGPNVRYWLRGKGHVDTRDNIRVPYTVVFDKVQDGNFENMYLNDVNRWMLGLSAGVGFSIDVTRGQTVFTELRYTHGHTYFGDKESASLNVLEFKDNLKSNYRIFSLAVSYQFGFNVLKMMQQQNLKRAKKPKQPK